MKAFRKELNKRQNRPIQADFHAEMSVWYIIGNSNFYTTSSLLNSKVLNFGSRNIFASDNTEIKLSEINKIIILIIVSSQIKKIHKKTNNKLEQIIQNFENFTLYRYDLQLIVLTLTLVTF